MASTRAGNPEGFRGWDFLSTPDTRLKPGANDSELALKKIVVTTALIPAVSPEEKENPSLVSWIVER